MQTLMTRHSHTHKSVKGTSPQPSHVPAEGQTEATEACILHSGIIKELDCEHEESLLVCCHRKLYLSQNEIRAQTVESDGVD